MDNRAIGVYDSGIGGTTVFKDLNKLLENENYIYFGDTKNLPYGTKSKEELLAISSSIFDFFAKKNVKAVVMACNTTSSMVYDEIKSRYDYEVYPIIQIAAKCIAPRYNGKMGVLATIGTVGSNKYKQALLKNNKNLEVFQQACPDWVKIVESGDYTSKKNLEIIEKCLRPLIEKGCKNIILGCTHYPYLTQVLTQMSEGKVNFINPSMDFTKFIKEDLTRKNFLSEKRLYEPEFFVSSNPEAFKIASKGFYELDKLPQLVIL